MLYEMSALTFFLALQWQHTVHRYLRVLHRRMMKRPPKKVTMDEARKAHHIRWPLLSQGTSGENGMITLILDMWMDGSGLNLSRFFDIIAFWSLAQPPPTTIRKKKKKKKLDRGGGERFRRFGELQPAPPDAPAAQPCLSQPPPAPLCLLIWLLRAV